MRDPIRQALATKDDAELGRILRTQHAELLASIALPFDPDPPTPEEVAEAFQFKYGSSRAA